MARIDPQELAATVKLHYRFIKGLNGGRRAMLMLRNVTKYRLPKINLSNSILAGSSFAGCNLEEADFSTSDLFGVDFSRANLRNAIFVKADLRGATLLGCDFSGADLSGADMRPGALMDAKMKLSKADMTEDEAERAEYIKKQISKGQGPLGGFDATESSSEYSVDLSNTKLVGANLSGAKLQNANMANADLANANLEGTRLDNVNMTGALLYQTRLAGASLIGVDLPASLDDLKKDVAMKVIRHNRWITTNGRNGDIFGMGREHGV